MDWGWRAHLCVKRLCQGPKADSSPAATGLGGIVRKAQSGDVRRYTSVVVLGIALLLLFVIYILPWLTGGTPLFGRWW